MSDPAPWPLNTTLWSYIVVNDRYEPRLLGRVQYVGRLGVTVRLAEADQFGDWETKLRFDCPGIWVSEEEARRWCQEKVGPWHHLSKDT